MLIQAISRKSNAKTNMTSCATGHGITTQTERERYRSDLCLRSNWNPIDHVRYMLKWKQNCKIIIIRIASGFMGLWSIRVYLGHDPHCGCWSLYLTLMRAFDFKLLKCAGVYISSDGTIDLFIKAVVDRILHKFQLLFIKL